MLTYGESGTSSMLPNLRSRLRALHGSPDGPLLAFRNGGTTMFSNVPYKGNSSYTTSLSGDRVLDIEAFGITGAPVASGTFSLAGGEDYTMIAVNRAASVELIKLDDNLPSTLGKACALRQPGPDGRADMLVNSARQSAACRSIGIGIPGVRHLHLRFQCVEHQRCHCINRGTRSRWQQNLHGVSDGIERRDRNQGDYR
jgi:hypothetical protein